MNNRQLNTNSPTSVKRLVDINCDLGEGNCISDCLKDAQLMPFISRCNIACGAHAGNHEIMQQSVIQAVKNGIQCGAHPGYADQHNFGRVSLNIPITELLMSVKSQIQQLLDITASLKTQLSHIKLHGALYNDAESNQPLANAICQLFKQHFPQLAVLGIANAQMQQAAQNHQLSFIREGFMDRAYQVNGLLVPRSETNAVHTDQNIIIQQAIALAKNAPFKSGNNQSIKLNVESICLHGDQPNAVTVAKALHSELLKQGYNLA